MYYRRSSYQKFHGRFKGEILPRGFQVPGDSNIPALKEHAKSLTQSRRTKLADGRLTEIGIFQGVVKMFGERKMSDLSDIEVNDLGGKINLLLEQLAEVQSISKFFYGTMTDEKLRISPA